VDGAPVIPLTPEEREQWPWKLEPLPGAASNDGLPTKEAEAKPKGKQARKGKGGAITEEALPAAVAQTAIGKALAGELAVEQTGPANRVANAASSRGG
jgi:hypothetical protein